MPNSIDPSKTQCGLLIFLATPTEEEGLLEAARSRNISCEKVSHPRLGEYFWLGQIGAQTVIASRPSKEKGRVVMGSHGRLGTAAKGIRLRENTSAQGIVQLGMAFGIDPEGQRLGDVLVSTALIPYDNRTVRGNLDGSVGYVVDYKEANRQPARPELVKLFRSESERDHPFGVRVGAILSGAARIHSAAFRDELVRGVTIGEDSIVGGEMEGVGLLAASLSADDPIWCVVKGISDFADENRDAVITAHRPIACRNAADFVLSALQNGRGR